MADNVIDSLSLEISSNAGSAADGLDRLTKSMLKLGESTGAIKGTQLKNITNFAAGIKEVTHNLSGFENFAKAAAGIRELTAAANEAKGTARGFTAISKNLRELTGIDFSNLSANAAGLNIFSAAIKELSNNALNLAGLKTADLRKTANLFNDLEKVNFAGLAQGAQGLSGIDFSGLQRFGDAFQNLSGVLANSEKVNTGVQRLITALAQLAASANNMPMVTAQLPQLSGEINRFIGVMAAAPAVNGGTVSLVTALSGLSSAGNKALKTAQALPALTDGVRAFIDSIAQMPVVDSSILRAVEALAQLSTAGGRAGTAAQNLKKNIDSLSQSMGGLSRNAGGVVGGLKGFVKQLLPIAGFAGGIYALGRALKFSIGQASDLAESENVVFQGFGGMTDAVEEFASTSIEKFGLSELAVKRTAGTFATMGTSLGLAQGAANDMALSLTGLTGDLASYYNVSQDVARTALQSVYTGETEALKKFGVVMTQANLQAYALAQGIGKSYTAMTSAEKVALRYNFVMDALSKAQGDFARTAGGSWANQLRILSEQFRQLASSAGTVLIGALLPAIKVINSLMAAINALVGRLASLFGGLFGIKDAGMSGGAGLANIADAATSAGAGAGELADNLSDAGGAAGKAKKQFNAAAQAWHEVNSLSSNEDAGGGGGAGGGGAGFGDLFQQEGNTLTAEDEVSPVLEKIKARMRELSDLFKRGFTFGLGDIDVFDSIQGNLKSIGESIKDIFTDTGVVNSFNALLDTLAYNAGAKAGAYVSIGATIADNLTGGVAQYLSTSKDRIKQYLIDMFNITGETDTIITNFTVAFADIFSIFRGDEAKGITASIIQIFADGFMGVTELAAKFGRDVLGLVLNPITENAEGFKTALQNTLAPINEILGTLADSFSTVWTDLNTMYDEHIAPLFESLTSGISEIVGSLLDGYNSYIAPVLDNLSKQFSGIWEEDVQPALSNAVGLIGDVADLIKTVWENVLQPVINWIAQNIMPAVAPVLELLGSRFNETFSFIGQLFNSFLLAARGVVQFLTNVFEGDWEGAWQTVKRTFSAVWDAMPDSITNPIETAANGLTQFINGAFSGDWSQAWTGIKGVFQGIWEGMPDVIKTPIRTIIGLVNKMIEGIESGINFVIDGINHLSFDIPDWVPEIGGSTFGFDLGRVSLPRIPELALGGIVKRPTIAQIGEAGPEAVIPLDENAQWISKVASQISKDFGRYKLDYSVPDVDFTPKVKLSEMGKFQSAMQMQMDARMAEYEFEMRQLRETNEQMLNVLEQIKAQGIVLDDNTFEKKYRSSASAYRKRTGSQLGIAY